LKVFSSNFSEVKPGRPMNLNPALKVNKEPFPDGQARPSGDFEAAALKVSGAISQGSSQAIW
jgi:hypothetical protein